MYTDMDLYAKVRRAVMVDAMSERAAARNFGISRKTVNKMVNHTAPPGYQRKDRPVAPKLGAFVGIIHQILQDDRDVLKKQRHTAQRIFECLRDEHQYAGGYTVVREFVAKERLRQQEVFIQLAHPPGHAQVDFGEADIYLGGVKTRSICYQEIIFENTNRACLYIATLRMELISEFTKRSFLRMAFKEIFHVRFSFAR